MRDLFRLRVSISGAQTLLLLLTSVDCMDLLIHQPVQANPVNQKDAFSEL